MTSRKMIVKEAVKPFPWRMGGAGVRDLSSHQHMPRRLSVVMIRKETSSFVYAGAVSDLLFHSRLHRVLDVLDLVDLDIAQAL
jgi:hypothetical protein